ncbi:hypothetical protein ASPWEDRAFT_25463 [Aspergillus wentii DTO 134E9]|uniref:Uncharacterized protein n=1 Tax=Aspergillus wentii DTO 134E9 TaxID=1073089 RepID=A0A1L9RXP7_ASPWE|nr:uncharacterized protein ASPWEDRAFT_25463 [Aspergillus wentii DTO 134E9]KAI9931673.1 hypothetical protein MW887_010250 [Aspergillus wentii]OJJ39654.1 hypothetical protein ASPWEDRAFT_25463 [Aspergillus wentii DTO 134E9]
MHKPSLAQIVYNATFPRPRTSDPATFSAHLARHLVPEVRVETSTFYGSLDCIEAQYPGLDYSYGPHRMRLGRFPWHRKLFKVFDDLGLTEEEISSLCRWEGTKSARQRYEKEHGVTVGDTTAQGIQPAAPSPLPSVEVHFDDGPGVDIGPGSVVEETFEDVVDSVVDDRGVDCTPEPRGNKKEQAEEEEDSGDDDLESCGVELNYRLLAATAAREQGVDVPLDEDWEQWLKEARERGSYADLISAIRSSQPLSFLAEMSTPLSHLGRTRTSTQMPGSLRENYFLPTSHPLSSGTIRRSSHQPSSAAR